MGKENENYFTEIQILDFIAFFTKRNYEPRNPNNLKLLTIKNWKEWPIDIVFIEKSFIKHEIFSVDKNKI
jgi:hypothetical protein